ncbi:AAA family ATPase [bacterium]|nr:AAA family ATPase [bacterium]
MDLFVEKYRPQSLEGFIGDNTVRDKVQEYLKEGTLQNLLLFGPAGTGKTSLAKLIVKQLEADHLYINASDERGIDTIRDKIVPFASSIGFNGLKVVILDESDYLTAQAQATLRNVIETFSASCRFIFTCNYLDRIISPLQSRCMAFGITPPSKKEVGQHVLQICDQEKIGYTKEDLGKIIITHYPDIRKILNTIQGSLKGGKLVLDSKSLKNTEFENKVVEGLKNKINLKEIRQIIANSGATQFESLFRCLYDNVEEYTTNIGDAIIIISQYQYEYSFVVDKEICIAAMLNKLLKL